ncbi:MAG: phosphodiester glycosidase family protein [Clostridia bacterium]|nr:phosphodiester glycosidase family protein [Clostridia bacterium]
MRVFSKPYAFALCFALLLTSFTVFALLDIFVVPRSVRAAETGDAANTAGEEPEAAEADEPVITASSYTDANISITIRRLREYGTDIYLADVVLSAPGYFKTALAYDTFGVNITQTTSSQAESKDAILAVNGDYYGANRRGYVLKNGTVYRESQRDDAENDDLVVYADGSFGLINETQVSADELARAGAVQLFAFGPALVQNGSVAVSEAQEVTARSMESGNPRTAIGVIGELHYLFVVSDGRTEESRGLSLYQLAELMAGQGCTLAYNLDGGGSSTMVFMGEVINRPTTSGRRISEREVSDIVYIGY